jgi:hypothetical protein
MATCEVCGDTVGFFASLCKRCKANNEYARQQEDARARAGVEAAERQLAEQRRLEIARVVDIIKDGLRQQLARGEQAFMYDSIYLGVDSVVNGESLSGGFDIRPLQRRTLGGWDVVQAVPRTVGIGLKNTSIGSSTGVTWGGGIGGNVAGVHVLLRKAIREADLDDSKDDNEVTAYCSAVAVMHLESQAQRRA